jgi:hypothetical protein
MVDFGIIGCVRQKLLSKDNPFFQQSASLDVGRWVPEEIKGPFVFTDIDEIWNYPACVQGPVGKVRFSLICFDEKTSKNRFLMLQDAVKALIDGLSIILSENHYGSTRLLHKVDEKDHKHSWLKSTLSFETVVFQK